MTAGLPISAVTYTARNNVIYSMVRGPVILQVLKQVILHILVNYWSPETMNLILQEQYLKLFALLQACNISLNSFNRCVLSTYLFKLYCLSCIAHKALTIHDCKCSRSHQGQRCRTKRCITIPNIIPTILVFIKLYYTNSEECR